MRAKSNRRRPQLEVLEGRELPAASVFLNGTVLSILGSNRAETVVVDLIGNQVVVSQANGGFAPQSFAQQAFAAGFPGQFLQANLGLAPQSFPAGAISQIIFRGLRGGDTFINNTPIRSDAFGDQGADLLIAGPAIDRLFGGPGPDRLIGGLLDVLQGGAGVDRIERLNTLDVVLAAASAFPGSAFFPSSAVSSFGLGLPSVTGFSASPFPPTSASGSLLSGTLTSAFTPSGIPQSFGFGGVGSLTTGIATGLPTTGVVSGFPGLLL